MCNALQYCTAVRRWFIIINKLKTFDYFYIKKSKNIFHIHPEKLNTENSFEKLQASFSTERDCKRDFK